MSGSRPPLLGVRASREPSGATLVLDGELDLCSGAVLRARVAALLSADPPPRRVVLDLSRLAFVDAAGIGVLVSAHRALADRGGLLVLRRPSAAVRRVLSLLDLDDLLQVET